MSLGFLCLKEDFHATSYSGYSKSSTYAFFFFFMKYCPTTDARPIVGRVPSRVYSCWNGETNKGCTKPAPPHGNKWFIVLRCTCWHARNLSSAKLLSPSIIVNNLTRLIDYTIFWTDATSVMCRSVKGFASVVGQYCYVLGAEKKKKKAFLTVLTYIHFV